MRACKTKSVRVSVKIFLFSKLEIETDRAFCVVNVYSIVDTLSVVFNIFSLFILVIA